MGALFTLLVAHATAAPQWTEEQLRADTVGVLDVLPWHQYVLRSQTRLDKPATFADLSLFGAPGSFVLPDGTEQSGALMRFGLGMGVGVGKPSTGVAAFGGMQFDYAMAQTPPILSSDGTVAQAASGIGYLGLAVKGWTATAGLLPVQRLVYTPEVGGREVPVHTDQIFSLYNQEGVAVAGVRGQDLSGADVLAAVRGELAPERLLERADLRKYGVFGVGFQHIAAGLDPYLDDPGPPEDSPAHAQVPLRAEDLGERGFRVVLVPEVAPRPVLRRAQVGYVFAKDEVWLGGQAGLVTRAGKVLPSVQVFASFRPEYFKYFSLYGVPRINVAYSYNVPDTVGFFPVAGAHVFGIQYMYGRAEFSRPLVPSYTGT